MSAPGWEGVLPAPPPGRYLHEAWMTSYDPPDAGLLVEHFLPALLATEHALSHEGPERSLFFGELGDALERLHGRLSVITSSSRGEGAPSPYPWLWRYVDRFMVGADSYAVQHAKLWAFHWKGGDDECLELQISSTNLTSSAFKDQLQAGWKVVLPLAPRVVTGAQKSWGKLIPFLSALGKSAGNLASERIQRLLSLFKRTVCPPDVIFVASIPGSPSAARQLAEFKASAIHVMTPTVGDWNAGTLNRWSRDVNVPADRLHLKWIPENHEWAERDGWSLSSKTYAVLDENSVNVECISNETRFAKAHHAADSRWCHAKLYVLSAGRKRWLLLTSANWSVSAWGAGKTSPRNFELGVAFPSSWSELQRMGKRFNPPTTIPFCCDRVEEEDRPSNLEWGQASWDGKRIELRVRSKCPEAPVEAVMGSADERRSRTVTLKGTSTLVRWTDTRCPPLRVKFLQRDSVLDVPVIDLRPPKAFAATPLPEVDPDRESALRDALLLQRYGGPDVDAPQEPDSPNKQYVKRTGPGTDYSVQTWIEARHAFDVVDQWAKALSAAKTDPTQSERIQLDGQRLRDFYTRQKTNSPCAGLVAEELDWRLRSLEKDG